MNHVKKNGERKIMSEYKLVLYHHCKKHNQYDSLCNKCKWWAKNGKCQIRKPFDSTEVYDRVLKYYLNKNYTKEQANQRAMDVVSKELKAYNDLTQ
jgi:hypothetical protein